MKLDHLVEGKNCNLLYNISIASWEAFYNIFFEYFQWFM